MIIVNLLAIRVSPGFNPRPSLSGGMPLLTMKAECCRFCVAGVQPPAFVERS